MLLIIVAIIGVYFLNLYFETEGGKYFLYEDSLWYEEYEKELQNMRGKSEELTCTDTHKLYEKYEKKEKKHYRNIIILLVFLGIVCILFLPRSYEEFETTKYELVAIQDEGLPKDKYYICEYVNKENTYMFYYKGENSNENIEIFADNVIKEYVDCNPYVIEEKRVKKTKSNILNKVLFFDFSEEHVIEANYKFYIFKDSILKTFK